MIINPEDTWGVGYANMNLESGEKEHLIEGYYNLLLTEKLRLSFHLTGVLDTPEGGDKFGVRFPGYPLPGRVLGAMTMLNRYLRITGAGTVVAAAPREPLSASRRRASRSQTRRQSS